MVIKVIRAIKSKNSNYSDSSIEIIERTIFVVIMVIIPIETPRARNAPKSRMDASIR